MGEKEKIRWANASPADVDRTGAMNTIKSRDRLARGHAAYSAIG
jgi:hypothetical protein